MPPHECPPGEGLDEPWLCTLPTPPVLSQWLLCWISQEQHLKRWSQLVLPSWCPFLCSSLVTMPGCGHGHHASRQGGRWAPLLPSLGTAGAHICTAHAGACVPARSLAELLRTTVTPERDNKLQRPLSSVPCPPQTPIAQLHHPGLFPHPVLTFACVLVQAQPRPYNTLLVPLHIQGLSPASWGPQKGRMEP